MTLGRGGTPAPLKGQEIPQSRVAGLGEAAGGGPEVVFPSGDAQPLPAVTFTDPEIGQAGLTEEQARQHGIDVRTGIIQVASSARGWIPKAGNDGFIKLNALSSRPESAFVTRAGP